MRPSIAIALLWPLIACVATNPAWDGPPVSDDGSGSSGDRSATDEHGSSAGTTNADDAGTETSQPGEAGNSETAPLPMEAGTSSEGGEASSSETGAGGCPTGESVCNGACVDISSDKHACGFYCVDCTVLFGNNARCDNGFCRAHGGGDDGDD